MPRQSPRLSFLKNSYWGRWFLLAIVTGIVAGLAAIIFQFGVQAIHHFALGGLAGYAPGDAAGEHSFFESNESSFSIWMLLLVITLGGLLSGYIVFKYAPEAEGHGTDGAIDAFHNQKGKIPIKIPIVKTIASAITLGTGGSAGKEGPIAQISAGLGSFLAQKLRLSTHDQRILLAMGMGAGIGAIFRAPLAGAIFAGEILYRDADIESEVIIPAAIASTLAYSVFQLSLPVDQRFTPLFGDTLEHEIGSIVELIPFTILALLLVLVSIVYITVFRFAQKSFGRLPILPHIKPAIGAFLTGVVAIAVFYVFNRDQNALASLGSGYGFLQSALDNVAVLSVPLLFGIAGAKIITTSLTIGSGGSGGVFGPSMVIGGAVGAGVGKLFSQWFPSLGGHPSAFAIVGMAGFFAACANAPFSTILMVTEMTGDYRLLLPTLWVSTICFILCRNWSIYSKQADSRLDSPAHIGDFTIDLLAGIQVSEVYRKTIPKIVFHEGETLDEIVHALAKSSQRYFHVYNSSDELVGVFSAEDVRNYLYDESLWKIAIASDVMTENVVTLQLDDDLNFAVGQFTKLNVDELPVVSSEDKNQVIGALRRKETIAIYNHRRLEFQKKKDDENS